MPYNGFEKYFIRETESRLASGYQSTEKMPRRSFPKAPFSADAYHPNCPFIGQAKAGLLTRPRRNAFPTPQDQWQKSVAAIHPGIRNAARKRADHLGSSGRTHSSGNCCRFTRHSLLIPLHGETIARQRYTFIGRKQAIRRNISAKRAPPLCAADRSDHDASLFRQTAARLWHALCTYFSQLRHSNRSEVSSFI